MTVSGGAASAPALICPVCINLFTACGPGCARHGICDRQRDWTGTGICKQSDPGGQSRPGPETRYSPAWRGHDQHLDCDDLAVEGQEHGREAREYGRIALRFWGAWRKSPASTCARAAGARGGTPAYAQWQDKGIGLFHGNCCRRDADAHISRQESVHRPRTNFGTRRAPVREPHAPTRERQTAKEPAGGGVADLAKARLVRHMRDASTSTPPADTTTIWKKFSTTSTAASSTDSWDAVLTWSTATTIRPTMSSAALTTYVYPVIAVSNTSVPRNAAPESAGQVAGQPKMRAFAGISG